MSVLLYLPHVNLSGFGLTDFSEPRYRVIWAPSRIMTLRGQGRVKTFPMYSVDRHIDPVGPFWILETWKSAASTGMTPEQWDRDPLYNSQEYPHRGEWYRVNQGIWENRPTISEIAFVIRMIEAGRMRRPIENAIAINNDVAYQEKERGRIIQDRILNRLMPWPAQPVSGRFSKGTKTSPVILTAQEAGLHTTGMKTGRMRKGYRVPVGQDGVIRTQKSRNRIVVP